MPTREEYNSCMRPYMVGQKPKEQRQLDFCVGAKLCSGKASSKEQAEDICKQPKAPKPPKAIKKRSGATCEKEVLDLSRCMAAVIDVDKAKNVNTVEMAIANAMLECKCGGNP